MSSHTSPACLRPALLARWLRRAGCLALAAAIFSGGGAELPILRGPQVLTLDGAVALALAGNAEIRFARQEVERIRGVYIEVRSQALPHVTLNASYEQIARSLLGGDVETPEFSLPEMTIPEASATPTPTATPTATPSASPRPKGAPSPSPTPPLETGGLQTKSWQVTIQVSQVLYAGGRIAAGIRMARLMEDQAVYQLRNVIDDTVARVRRQFYAMLLQRALITVQEAEVRLLEDQAGDQRARYAAGTVPRFNVLQAEVALANARPGLLQARNRYSQAQLDLARTLGVDTGYLGPRELPFEPVGTLGVPPLPGDLAAAIAHARLHRPSLKAQRQNILIEMQDVIIQRAGYKPTLAASAGYTVKNDPFSDQLGDVVHGWFFGVQGNWALFDGLETYGRVRQAKAKLRQAGVRYDDAVRTVEVEVRRAWEDLREALATVASQQENLVQAAEALRLARERLAAGAGTQLDVLNAAVSQTQARSTELQARHDYNAALAEFDRATGAATRYADTFEDPLAKKAPPRPSKRSRSRVE